MAQIQSDNFQVNAPKNLDNKTGKFVAGVWMPFDNVAEFFTKNVTLSLSETQTFFVRSSTDTTKADMYAVAKGRTTAYKVSADVDLSNYYTKSQVDGTFASLSDVSRTGDYNDLLNLPNIPGLAPVQSVNGRIGAVTDLAEQSDLTIEVLRATAAELLLQPKTDETLATTSKVVPLAINEVRSQLLQPWSDLITFTYTGTNNIHNLSFTPKNTGSSSSTINGDAQFYPTTHYNYVNNTIVINTSNYPLTIGLDYTISTHYFK